MEKKSNTSGMGANQSPLMPEVLPLGINSKY